VSSGTLNLAQPTINQQMAIDNTFYMETCRWLLGFSWRA